MYIAFCASCGKKYRIPDKEKKYRCKECGGTVQAEKRASETVASSSQQETVEKKGPEAGPKIGKRTYQVRSRRKRKYARVAWLPVGHIISGSIAMYFRNFFLFTIVSISIFSPLFLLLFFVPFEGQELILPLAIVLFQQLVTGTVIYGVFRRLKGDSAGFVRCLAVGMSRFFHLMLAIILAYLLIGVIVLVPVIIASILVVIMGQIGAAAMAIPIFLLAFIPAIILYCAFYIAAPVVVVEKATGNRALRRSFNLTRSNRIRIFGVVIVFGICQALVNWILTKLFLGDYAGLPYEESLMAAEKIIHYARMEMVIQIVVAMLFTAITAIASALIYYNLKVQVEGADEKELASVFD